MNKFRVAVILGIRPDFIRTSKVLKLLKSHPDIEATFISTGQHYDYELKGIFLEELGVPEPDITLDTAGATHCQQHSKLIEQLEPVLSELNPDICLFLGDANAVIGSIVPLKLGIPIAHIEAGMRSYDWRMPEERNRVIIDRISDVLYVYHENYKNNLIREGISSARIKVVGNIIVDILKEYQSCFNERRYNLIDRFKLPMHYAIMTMHRNENVTDRTQAQRLVNACSAAAKKVGAAKVIFIEMPRVKNLNISYPENFLVEKPIGFFDFMCLEQNATIEFTDSGTNQETAAINGTPAVILRKSTERPETFKSMISEMAFETHDIYKSATAVTNNRIREFLFKDYEFNEFGNGQASERIVEDLVYKLKTKALSRMRETPWIDLEIASHF
jgi:UDP-N-acetylglucosamine 2-epimerase